MLKVEKLNVYYGESHILRDVDLEVRPGEVLCLMGRNGVGKTTLLKTITGRLPARSGRVSLGEKEVTRLPSFRRARLGVGYAPQGREIFGQLSVWENLLIGLDGCRNGDRSVPDEVFELFPVLKQMLKRKGGDLSGGQQQQLAIGRALAIDAKMPKLLILDEPTEGIQPNIVHEIGDIIMQLNEAGLAVLAVEQKLPFARRVGRSFCMMDRGRAVAEGRIAELTDEIVRQHLIV